MPPAAPFPMSVEVKTSEDESIQGDDSERRGESWETSLPQLFAGGLDVPPPVPARTPGWERDRETVSREGGLDHVERTRARDPG